jgi:hypothetical protein
MRDPAKERELTEDHKGREDGRDSILRPWVNPGLNGAKLRLVQDILLPLRELRSLVGKGNQYELEFEDEYDSGTIAKLERLFFARFAICWYQSIGQVDLYTFAGMGRPCAVSSATCASDLGSLPPYCLSAI